MATGLEEAPPWWPEPRLGQMLTCARQGASLTLAAPSFAHSAAAADLLGDALGQRQGAGARPQRPVAQPLLHGDGLVGCNRHGRCGGQVASLGEVRGGAGQWVGGAAGSAHPAGLARVSICGFGFGR